MVVYGMQSRFPKGLVSVSYTYMVKGILSQSVMLSFRSLSCTQYIAGSMGGSNESMTTVTQVCFVHPKISVTVKQYVPGTVAIMVVEVFEPVGPVQVYELGE